MPVDLNEPSVADELEVVNNAIAAIPKDAGAPFESEVVEALRLIRESDLAEYQRLRQRLKDSKISITALEQLVKHGGPIDETTVADELLNLVSERLDLFHSTENKKEYASFDVDGHQETHACFK